MLKKISRAGRATHACLHDPGIFLVGALGEKLCSNTKSNHHEIYKKILQPGAGFWCAGSINHHQCIIPFLGNSGDIFQMTFFSIFFFHFFLVCDVWVVRAVFRWKPEPLAGWYYREKQVAGWDCKETQVTGSCSQPGMDHMRQCFDCRCSRALNDNCKQLSTL